MNQWIRRVREQVCAPGMAEWVGLQVAARFRRIVPKAIVVQAQVLVVDVPGEPVPRRARCVRRIQLAVGIDPTCLPYERPARALDTQRHAGRSNIQIVGDAVFWA